MNKISLFVECFKRKFNIWLVSYKTIWNEWFFLFLRKSEKLREKNFFYNFLVFLYRKKKQWSFAWDITFLDDNSSVYYFEIYIQKSCIRNPVSIDFQKNIFTEYLNLLSAYIQLVYSLKHSLTIDRTENNRPEIFQKYFEPLV